MTSEKKQTAWWLPASVATLVLVAGTRLPFLFGKHLLPDGDEAVLGLMARGLAEGRELGLFFSGQSYGLSIVESACAALAFTLFGSSVVALKAAMLPLFSLSILLMASAARRLMGNSAGWLTLILLALLPAWGAFALKARGGYLTAYALAALVLFVASKGARDGKACSAPRLGLALGATLAVQPIWLVPVLPFAALRLFANSWRERMQAAACALALPGLSLLLARLLGAGGLDWSPSLVNRELGLALLLEWPRDLWEASGGAFYLREVSSRSALRAVAFVWALATTLALALSLLGRVSFSTEAGVDHRLRSCARALAAGCILASAVALPTDTPRYLLPALAFSCLLLALCLHGAIARRSPLSVGVFALLLLSGQLGFSIQRTLPLAGSVEPKVESEAQALDNLLEELESQDIQHVYCEHHLLQWILTFTSDEAIIARWHPFQDRVPRYPVAVDQAFASGSPVAWVGYRTQLPAVHEAYRSAGLELPTEQPIEGAENERYFVIRNPAQAALTSAGFELALR